METEFTVYVGNVGTVYPELASDPTNHRSAQLAFYAYVERSKMDTGRCAGEDVTMFKNGDVFNEYHAPRPFRCDQCEALMINGVFCHETGCPNTNARYDAEDGVWIKQYECRECGQMCDEDTPCCLEEFSLETETFDGKFSEVQSIGETYFVPTIYAPSEESTSIGYKYGVRMRMPGYLDATEWEVFDTEEERDARQTEMEQDGY